MPLNRKLLDVVRRAMDLPGAASDHLVVVAMSGGVDSTTTAGLLAAAGFRVAGVTLRLHDAAQEAAMACAPRGRTCCAGRDIVDARLAADRLGIPHYVLDMANLFRREVIERFCDSYMAGETPVPCVDCNRAVKFDALLKHAQELGASALVTGHYVESRRLSPDAPRRGLFTPADMSRDQSYFLHATTQEQLDYLRFPLASLTKAEVREAAAALGLDIVADKPASQDICFVPQGDYRRVVLRHRPLAARPGPILHVDGRVLGKHAGIINYTIGQRRGLGIAIGEPLYVVALDAARNAVIVGPRDALKVPHLTVRTVNWLGDAPLPKSEGAALPVWARIRSTRPPQPARVWQAEGEVHVRFEKPEEGVAPGQACVFYAGPGPGQRVLGGGTITRTKAAIAPPAVEWT